MRLDRTLALHFGASAEIASASVEIPLLPRSPPVSRER